MINLAEKSKKPIVAIVFTFMVLSTICFWSMASVSHSSHGSCPIANAANTTCVEAASGHFDLFEIIISQNSGTALALLSLLFVAFLASSTLLSELRFSPHLTLLRNREILQTSYYHKSRSWLYRWLSLKNKNLYSPMGV